MAKRLLFLDFDGVICNSVLECLYSATIAYFSKYLKVQITSLPLSFKEGFIRYRPYIRTGEDYVVLADLVARGVEIHGQEDFDRELQSNPVDKLSLFRDLFYQTRRELIAHDFLHWMRLNPLYPGIKQPLLEVAQDPTVYILSTKVSDLIRRILLFHGIDWPEERILYSHTVSKKEIIGSLLTSQGAENATLLDDQLDHLRVAMEDRRITPFLAGWEYVNPEWLEQREVPVLPIEEFRAFLLGHSLLAVHPDRGGTVTPKEK
jgi:phosphoglycolate phosphatase-like HAD superfamily hydrolase